MIDHKIVLDIGATASAMSDFLAVPYLERGEGICNGVSASAIQQIP